MIRPSNSITSLPVSTNDILCPTSQKPKRGPRGGIYDPFPVKFHRVLGQLRDEGQESVVSWLSHGRAFKIHKPKIFAASIMPRFFNQSKYTSFQRQLNLYGFSRCCRGRDSGAYHHPYFLRGKLSLAKNIIRTKVKGNGHKMMRLHAEAEPDFYAMPPLKDDAQAFCCDGSSVGSAPGSLGHTAAAAPTATDFRLPDLPTLSCNNFVLTNNESPSPVSTVPLIMAEQRDRSALISEGGSTSEFVNDLNQSIFIHELAMGCTILCQLRKDTNL